MSTLTEPHTNGHDRDLGGVRTYRGRKLEDLIPQIRAELGPDAIILRQREGLMGGVGGFFAQKCVEVDAQASPRVDIYDEDEPVNGWELTDEDEYSLPALPALPAPAAEEPVTPAPVPAPVPAPEAIVPAPEAPVAFEAPAAREDIAPVPTRTPAPEAPASPQAAIPAPPATTPPAATPPVEGAAESFVTRLEQAAAHVDIEELVKLVTTGGLPTTSDVDEAPAPVVPEAPAPAPAPFAAEPIPAPEPVAPAPAPAPEPVASPRSPSPP